MYLLVGASVRALMESAVESGYPVMGLDFFGDLDTRRCGKTVSIVNELGLAPTVKDLLQVARSVTCQGMLYASGPENHPKELAFWEERGLLCGNGVSAVKQVRDPWQLRQALSEIGIAMPGFYRVEQWSPDETGKKWLLKPLDRGGGHGILELPQEKGVAPALISSLRDPSRYIVEEYISGIPASVTFLADAGQTVVLGTSRQLPGLQELRNHLFTYVGNIVPLDPSFLTGFRTFEEDLIRISQHLASVFGLKGVNTLDFIVNSRGIWVLELNPRWSASVELIEKWRGERLFPHHIAACKAKGQNQFPSGGNNRKPLHKPGLPGFWGKSVVYAQSSFQVTADLDIQSLYEQGVRDIPPAGTRLESGQPICTVLSGAASDAACWQSLQLKSEWARKVFGDIKSSAAR